jgi:septum formation protein
MRLVLASASPRRAELLAAAGYRFEVCPTDVDEGVRAGERPEEYVRRLAIEKSAAALVRLLDAVVVGSERPADAGRHESPAGLRAAEAGNDEARYVVEQEFSRTDEPGNDLIIIGADTAVILDDQILGKPIDRGDAERMLRLLAGRTHVVLTGLSVRTASRQLDAVERTSVTFAELSDRQIAWYSGTGEGRDKAGAYAIQGLASRFIPRIDGSYSNVVGLPVAAVDELIRALQGSHG